MSRPFVADASVGIKLCLEEEYSEEVSELFPSVLPLVPDLFYVECANVLWKRVKRGFYARYEAEASIADLISLNLPATPTIDLVGPALVLSCDYDISAYDAIYVALAEAKHLPLVTADIRLQKAVAESSVQVLTIPEYLGVRNHGSS